MIYHSVKFALLVLAVNVSASRRNPERFAGEPGGSTYHSSFNYYFGNKSLDDSDVEIIKPQSQNLKFVTTGSLEGIGYTTGINQDFDTPEIVMLNKLETLARYWSGFDSGKYKVNEQEIYHRGYTTDKLRKFYRDLKTFNGKYLVEHINSARLDQSYFDAIKNTFSEIKKDGPKFAKDNFNGIIDFLGKQMYARARVHEQSHRHQRKPLLSGDDQYSKEINAWMREFTKDENCNLSAHHQKLIYICEKMGETKERIESAKKTKMTINKRERSLIKLCHPDKLGRKLRWLEENDMASSDEETEKVKKARHKKNLGEFIVKVVPLALMEECYPGYGKKCRETKEGDRMKIPCKNCDK